MFDGPPQPPQFEVFLRLVVGSLRDCDSDSASGIVASGRNTEHGESREYGPPTPFDADLDELRSEIAVLVAFAEQHEPLIPARPQWLLHRQRLVVTPHYGEIQ